jgi:hypothetical protein
MELKRNQLKKDPKNPNQPKLTRQIHDLGHENKIT